MEKKFLMKVFVALLFLALLLTLIGLTGSKDLVASLAQLPGLADSPDKGAFVDLVKAMDEVYTEGTIKIEIYPFARSVNNVIKGTADFHIPTVRNPIIDQSKLPYKTVKIPMGEVCFVIYSNINKPITKKMLEDAISSKNNFPYTIEIPGGIENQFPFKGYSSNDIEKSLKKLSDGRIDALVWAQEEVDNVIKQLKIKNIKREFWTNFDDVIIIPKGTEGDKLDKLISDILQKLKANGKLAKLHLKVHHSFDDWQPAKMGW